MTLFYENEEARSVAPTQAATGPRVGFMDAFEASWEAQVRTSAQLGMWVAFSEEEDAQIQRLKEAGIEGVPRIGPEATGGRDDNTARVKYGGYKDAAYFYLGSGDEDSAARMRDYDTKMEALRKQYPDLGIKSGRELYEDVLRKGVEAEERYEDMRTTWGGAAGSFFGGALASMNPKTDPLNFATLAVGGFGKTALSRIGTEMGAQGVIEGLNQGLGVQEQREMMGLSSGFGDALSRVAGTAIAGGMIQTAGEGLAYAGRRWFRSTDTDPAPPPPAPYEAPQKEPLLLEYRPAEWSGQAAWEQDVKAYQESLIQNLMRGTRDYTDDIIPMAGYGKSRSGVARARIDLEHVASRLDNWDGEAPFEVKPRGMTAPPSPVRGVAVPPIRTDAPGASIDAIAREVDPKLFGVYDKLADEKAVLQKWLQDPENRAAQSAAVKKAEATIEDLNTKIENLRRNMSRVGSKRKAQMQPKLDALNAERAKVQESLSVRDTPEMAQIRKQLMRVDEKMRDMAPLVSRAYAQAKDKWELDAPERELVRQMVREGRKDLPQADAPTLAGSYEDALRLSAPTLEDRIPLLRQAHKVEGKVKPGADAAEIVTAILKENAKSMDAAIETFRASLDRIVKDTEESVVTINGEKHKFDLDKDTIHIVDDEGNSKSVTIRELLEDNADTEAELKAVQTCSIV